ncbi:MAG: hypothetical protein ACI4TM_03630, partial [Candidatus Cryptobacteroides sp.]
FASTRLRNGKHESNPPSRFIREIDMKYLANPLKIKDEEQEDDFPSDSSGWSSWGGYKTNSRYQSGFSDRNASRSLAGASSRPQTGVPSRTKVVESASPVSKPLRSRNAVPVAPVVDFEPTPVMQLRSGQRIEHNRFGKGLIKTITGERDNLKANIVFDDHGEKILLLKYAKIRVVE